MSASLRPSVVKRFQTIHHHSFDVARGLVLLYRVLLCTTANNPPKMTQWVDAVEKGKNEPINNFTSAPVETGFW